MEQNNTVIVSGQKLASSAGVGFTMDQSQSMIVMYRSSSDAHVSVIKSDIPDYSPYIPEALPNVELKFALAVKAKDKKSVNPNLQASLFDVMIDKWQVDRSRNITARWGKENGVDIMDVSIISNSDDRKRYGHLAKRFIKDGKVSKMLAVDISIAHPVVDNCDVTMGCNGTFVMEQKEVRRKQEGRAKLLTREKGYQTHTSLFGLHSCADTL